MTITMEEGVRRPGLTNRASMPTRQVLETACCLVADTSNGVSAVKVGDVVLHDELARAMEVIDDHPGTRQVLRRARDGSVALVIEQAIEPVHHLPRHQPFRLARLWPWHAERPNSPQTPEERRAWEVEGRP